MGLRRRIVKTLLKKYVKNLQERHIHVSVARGIVRIDEAVLDIPALAELLVGLLPDGVEITEAKASDLRLDIPWKNLKTRSTTISIGEVAVSLTHHPASNGLSENPNSYWATGLKQRKQMLQDAQALARKGLVPIGGHDVVSAIMAGLQVSIDVFTLSIRKSPSACEEFAGVVEPHAVISIGDFFLGPVDQRLQRLTTFSQSEGLAYQSKDLRFGAISLRVLTGGQLKKLLHPAALNVRILTYMPSNGKVVCPFPCTTRLELDMDTVCIDGDEEQVQELLRTLIDFGDALEVQRRALGVIPWSNDDYARCYGEDSKSGAKKAPEAVTRRPSTGSLTNVFKRKTNRASSPNGSVAGSDAGSNAGSVAGSVVSRGSKSGMFRRFMPSTKLLTRKTNHSDTGQESEAPPSPNAFLLDDLDAEDSDDLDVEEDDTGSKLDDAEFTEGTDYQTPMAMIESCDEEQLAARLTEAASELSSKEHLQLTWNVGSVRQDTISVEVGTLRVGILFPSEGRAEVTITKLFYRQICRAWLSEAEQICATRVGGRFVNATAAPSFERGGNSVDTIINIDHQLSTHTCRFTYSEFGKPEENAETPEERALEDQCQTEAESATHSVLIEPLAGKGDNIKVKWRSGCGEPCRDVDNDNMFIWPLEVVVRGMQLLYLPTPFQRLGESFKPVIADMIDWDDENQLANNRARLAQWSKTIAFRNVAVQQPVEGTDLPHKVKIHAATLDNVTSKFNDIATFLGLVSEEMDDIRQAAEENTDGDGKTMVDFETDVQSMSEEQLRAEVLMWRSKHGVRNGEQQYAPNNGPKKAPLHFPI